MSFLKEANKIKQNTQHNRMKKSNSVDAKQGCKSTCKKDYWLYSKHAIDNSYYKLNFNLLARTKLSAQLERIL